MKLNGISFFISPNRLIESTSKPSRKYLHGTDFDKNQSTVGIKEDNIRSYSVQ